MKVSIWQQFSSNHSASYTVVGLFESSDTAQQTALQLKQLVTEITAWYKEHPETFNSDKKWKPTPIEESIAKSHNIDWHEPIDWIYHFGHSDITFGDKTPDEFISNLDNCIFIDGSSSRTWQAGQQFVSYLKAMGGKTYRDVYMGYDFESETNPIFDNIEIELKAIIPSNDIFTRLDKLFHITTLGHLYQRFDGTSYINMPWVTYHPNYVEIESIIQPSEYEIAEEVYLREKLRWEKVDNKSEINEKDFFIYDDNTRVALWLLRRDVSFEVEKITVENNVVTFIGFTATSIAQTLSALIQWLRSLDCKVSYEFHQHLSNGNTP